MRIGACYYIFLCLLPFFLSFSCLFLFFFLFFLICIGQYFLYWVCLVCCLFWNWAMQFLHWGPKFQDICFNFLMFFNFALGNTLFVLGVQISGYFSCLVFFVLATWRIHFFGLGVQISGYFSCLVFFVLATWRIHFFALGAQISGYPCWPPQIAKLRACEKKHSAKPAPPLPACWLCCNCCSCLSRPCFCCLSWFSSFSSVVLTIFLW